MVVIDVLNDAGGRELLLKNPNGEAARCPCSRRSDQYAMGQMLDPFAKFAGLPMPGADRLSPEQLYKKYEIAICCGPALRAAISRQERFRRAGDSPSPARDQDAVLSRVFRIGESFLETWDGGGILPSRSPITSRRISLQTGDDIARYGAKRLERAWRNVVARGRGPFALAHVEDGTISAITSALRVPLEREIPPALRPALPATCGGACKRMGVKVDTSPLTPADLAGLPLPERLWE